jgi:RHH-type proline utilization regulon transcriptional repressor/proline dehydrogenase/delta 1-pyrroline-5-carboxylate dehydrogenase
VQCGASNERAASTPAPLTLPPRIASWLDAVCAAHPQLRVGLTTLARDYVRDHTRWFASGHDATGLVGEDNVFRYRSLSGVALVVNADSQLRDVAQVALAAAVVECPLHVLAQGDQRFALTALDVVRVADEEELLAALDGLAIERVRCLCPPTEALYRMSHRNAWHVELEPPSAFGRIELPRYLKEQAVSVLYHRYGHLGLRAGVARSRH